MPSLRTSASTVGRQWPGLGPGGPQWPLESRLLAWPVLLLLVVVVVVVCVCVCVCMYVCVCVCMYVCVCVRALSASLFLAEGLGRLTLVRSCSVS